MASDIKLSPSSAGTWVHCPGSIKMKQMYPDTRPKDAANDGTESHNIAAEFFSNGMLTPGEPSEMRDMAIEYFNEYCGEYLESGKFGIESWLTMKVINPIMKGIADLWYIRPDGTVVIVDYKYGKGVVEAYENFQLASYACSDMFAGYDNFELHIFQPRTSEPKKIWRVDKETVSKYGIMMKFAADRALEPEPMVKAGSHCHYCPAMLHCKSNKETINAIINRAVPYDLPIEVMGREYEILKEQMEVLKYRFTSLEQEMISRLMGGDAIPGYALERTNGRVTWTCSDSEAISVAALYGVDIAKTAEPVAITPLQAIKSGVPKEIIDQFSSRSEGKLQLTSINKIFN